MSDKRMCAAWVKYGTKSNGSEFSCPRLGKHEHDGQWWCWVHNPGSKRQSMSELRAENATLRKIAADLQIMAKRYAEGRMTFAALTVNQHTQALLDMGVKLNPGAERIIWAIDGGGERYQRELTEEQKTPGTPAAMGQAAPDAGKGAGDAE